MRSASEMASAARAARERQQVERQLEAERLAKQAAAKAALDQKLDALHSEFEVLAFAAARDGQQALAVPGHELSQSRLKEQGFIVASLTRRPAFEEHLAGKVRETSATLSMLAEQAVSLCAGLERVDGDALNHRNALVSLLDTLWRRGQIVEPYHIEVLLAYARIHTAARPSDLEKHKALISRVLQSYVDQKTTEQKYSTVKWENLMVPAGAEKATYVSWESADDGQGLVLHFSAPRLRWINTQWPDFGERLEAGIGEAAEDGKSKLDVFTWRTERGWDMSWEWPPEEDCGTVRRQTKDGQILCIYEGYSFCAPQLAKEELAAAGYSVDVQRVKPADWADANDDLDKIDVSTRACDAHKLTIRWEEL